MICKKCGKYNPDYNKACVYCGYIFPEENNSAKGNYHRCESCGKHNPADKEVYVFCGHHFEKKRKTEQ